MVLNKSTGNMYAFVSHTYNPLKGECEHSCLYCFMKRKLLLPPLRLELKELKMNLGKGNSLSLWVVVRMSGCGMYFHMIISRYTLF